MTRIALVVLDTLRHDVFGKYFSWLESRGTVFDNAFSNSHWTVPAHAALFTGESPVESGVHHNARFLDTDTPTLAETVRENGFTTRMMTQNSHVGPAFEFDRGFDHAFDTSGDVSDPIADRQEGVKTDRDWWLDWRQNNDAGLDNLDRVIADAFAAGRPTGRLLATGLKIKIDALWGEGGDGGQRIRNQIERASWSDDEFLFINLMEAHQPYRAPKAYRTIDPCRIDGLRATFDEPGTSRKHLWQAYIDEVRYLSDQFRDIHDRLLSDDFDYVITVSDHGELFGEGDRWEHQSGLEPHLVRIPAVVTGPDCEDTNVETPVTLREIHDMVLELSRGTDLQEAIHAVRERSTCFGIESLLGITEYHGLDHRVIDELEAEGHDLTGWDEPMYGLVYPRGYAFPRQDDDELHTVGDVPNSVEDHHDAVRSAQPEPSRGEQHDVSDEIKDRLRQLGYTN